MKSLVADPSFHYPRLVHSSLSTFSSFLDVVAYLLRRLFHCFTDGEYFLFHHFFFDPSNNPSLHWCVRLSIHLCESLSLLPLSQ